MEINASPQIPWNFTEFWGIPWVPCKSIEHTRDDGDIEQCHLVTCDLLPTTECTATMILLLATSTMHSSSGQYASMLVVASMLVLVLVASMQVWYSTLFFYFFTHFLLFDIACFRSFAFGCSSSSQCTSCLCGSSCMYAQSIDTTWSWLRSGCGFL